MRLSKLLDVTMAILLISSFFIIIITTAEEDIESRAETEFDIDFKAATDLKIGIITDVSEIIAFETIYNGNDIESLATSTEYDDIITMGGIMQTLHDLLKNQMEMSFENANVVPLNTRPTYQNKAVFYEEYMVNLTSVFFSMNETVNAHDFINGVLDMDAVVSYAFEFHAEPGWNNTYTLALPISMNRPYTDGKVTGNNIQWEVLNGDGEQSSATGNLDIQMKNPTTSESNAEDISLEFELDARNEKITNCEEANKLLKREYRHPWKLPE